ncbi:ent-kaurene oxidase [Xylariomycetidae sp. FL2044]|nr:ent-kaurene oxidase [Xylariomycetidae sp. FL2044]
MPSIVENSAAPPNLTTAMHSQPLQAFVSRSTSYYVAIGLVLICIWLFQPSKQRCDVSAPFYKASRLKWMFSADTLLRDSYTKFRDSVYQVRSTEGVRTLIPANLVGELKGLPEETLSATTAVSEAMLSEYTKLSAGVHSDTLTFLLKSKLSSHLARMMPKLKGELQYILNTEFSDCEDWTPLKVQPFMVRTIARLSGRVFVGPTLNRTEEWMDVSINFAITAFIAVIKLQFFPPWVRPAAQYMVSELKTIEKELAQAQAMITPIIQERMRDSETPGYEKPDDFIQWLLDALPEEEKTDYYTQARIQLLLAASSIHTTSNLTTDCIYDLALHQDMQDILRQEAHEVLECEEGWDKKESIGKLKKMDSFVKESQRLSGNVTSFIRKVMKPIDLSDGTHLPAGTDLLTPLAGVSRDERFYPDPEVFDGLRFWKLRQQSEEASNRYQFTSITDTSQNFGLGKHACPGRFFAGNEIKTILAYLLLNYDLKFKDGEGRPKPNMFMMTKGPNMQAEVLFRRRR